MKTKIIYEPVSGRKKASVNLRDTDHAKERYAELVDLVRFGKGKLNYYTEKEYYEVTIDPDNGADWNQTAPIDTRLLFALLCLTGLCFKGAKGRQKHHDLI